MDSKPDNKCENRVDIILVIEIITNTMHWQSAIEAFLFLAPILVISQLFVRV